MTVSLTTEEIFSSTRTKSAYGKSSTCRFSSQYLIFFLFVIYEFDWSRNKLSVGA